LCCLGNLTDVVADIKIAKEQASDKRQQGNDQQESNNKRRRLSKGEQQGRRRDALSQRLTKVIQKDKYKEREEENNRLIATFSIKEIGERRILLEEFRSTVQSVARQPGITQAELVERAMNVLRAKYAMLSLASERKSQIEKDPRYLEMVEKGIAKVKQDSTIAVFNMQERERVNPNECARYITDKVEHDRRNKGERMFDVRILIYKDRTDAENAMKLLENGSVNDAIEAKEQKDASKAFHARVSSSLGEVLDANGKIKPSARFRDLVREDGFLDFEHPFLPDVWTALSNYKSDDLGCVGPVRLDLGSEQYYFVISIVGIKEYSVCESDIELEQILTDFVNHEAVSAKRIKDIAKEIKVEQAK
jgi:hypothetical protein